MSKLTFLSELLCISEIDQSLRSSTTRAAVDAILGKFLSGNDSRETAIGVIRPSPLAATAPAPSIAPVASSSSPDGQPVPPINTNTITEEPKTASKCPVCDKTPSHPRSKCPLIKAGIIAMRKRIAELQQNTPDGNDEEREKVIEELQRIIDKRTKRNQTRKRETKSTNVISMADKSVISPDSSPAIEPPKTSQIVKPAKAPSLEDGPEVNDEPERSQGRIPSSEVQGEEEEEASPFTRSIIPLPTRSTSEPLNEDESPRPEDLQGDTSFHEVNDLGSSMEVDKTGDAVVNDAYALDFAHLSALTPSENGHKVVKKTKTGSDKALQSDPIEASEKPESSSPQSPIVSMEDDTQPRQSTPKAEVSGRTGSQRISSKFVRKPTGLTFKPQNVASRTVNGIRKNSKSTKKAGGLSRITDLPMPFISNGKHRSVRRRVGSDSEVADSEEMLDEDRQEAARAGEEGEEVDEEVSMDLSQAIPNTRVKTPAKVPVPSTMKRKEDQSLASWAVINSPTENESGMVDELRSDTQPVFPSIVSGDTQPAFPPVVNGGDTQLVFPQVVNGVSNELDPLFLHSETQQSFPYSQYPNVLREPPDSEDEEDEDEVQAFVVKPQTLTKGSSKFRSLTEIASRPTLFTPTMHLTQNNGTKEEVMNLYGRTKKAEEEEEESSDSDTESESDPKPQTSHIPMSRRAGTLPSRRG